ICEEPAGLFKLKQVAVEGVDQLVGVLGNQRPELGEGSLLSRREPQELLSNLRLSFERRIHNYDLVLCFSISSSLRYSVFRSIPRICAAWYLLPAVFSRTLKI